MCSSSFHLFNLYTGSWTWAKPYGIKPRCHLEHLGESIWEHLGNYLGTLCEHKENTVGTKWGKKKSLSPLPPTAPSPPPKKKTATIFHCMLSLPIDCMKFFFPKLFFNTPSQELGAPIQSVKKYLSSLQRKDRPFSYTDNLWVKCAWKKIHIWHQDFQNLARAYLKTQLLVSFGLVSLQQMILKVTMIRPIPGYFWHLFKYWVVHSRLEPANPNFRLIFTLVEPMKISS